MEKTLKILNVLEREGTISRYAIGGTMAVAYYAEPIMTDELDIFVALPQTASGLPTLAPIYIALKAKGYREKGLRIVVEGVPVQFIPTNDLLSEEALSKAHKIDYLSTPTRVLGSEYLAAIAVQAGQERDKDTVRRLLHESRMDSNMLKEILVRHDLFLRLGQWTE